MSAIQSGALDAKFGQVDEHWRPKVVAALNGMALGLRDVFDPVVREEPPIVQDAPGEPHEPRHVDAHLDPDNPAASSVTVRPWRAAANGPT